MLRNIIESIESNNIDNLVTFLSSKEGNEIILMKENMSTLVVTASQNGSFECLKVLIEDYGVDINSKDRFGNSAITVAINTSTVQYLLSHGADANSSNKRGFTAIMNAAKIGNQNCLSLLIESGGDVNIPENYNNRTALMFASISGFENCVRILLEKGADVNRVDFERKTALIYASQLGHEQCVDVLNEFNADMNITDYRGRSAQSYSTFKGILQELISGNSLGDVMMK